MNQNILINMVHLYADQYKWTKDYTLENVYLDEHIINEKIIKKQQQQELSIQTSLSMLPMIQDDKKRNDLIENLHSLHYQDDEKSIRENNSTTFEETKNEIEKAKIQLKKIQNRK